MGSPFKYTNGGMQMRSYLEILNELMEAIEADEMMPKAEKENIKEQIRAVLDLLWKYSH